LKHLIWLLGIGQQKRKCNKLGAQTCSAWQATAII